MTNTGRGRGPGGEAPTPAPDDPLARLGAAARAEESELSGLPPTFASALSVHDRGAMAQGALALLGADSPVPAPVTIRHPRRRWFWPSLLVPLAAACALVLVLRPRTGPGPLPFPPYEITASGGLRETRGIEPNRGPDPAQAALQRVAAGTELIVVARPAIDVRGQVGARAFLVEGGQAHETEAHVQVAPSGSVELRVRPANAAQGARGAASLRIVVGRPSVVRAATARDALRAVDAGPDVRWLTVPLDLLGG